MPRSILVDMYSDNEEINIGWKQELSKLLPSLTIMEWRNGMSKIDETDPRFKDVEFALIWTFPVSELSKMPNLRAVLLHGNGTNHLFPLSRIPHHLPIVRLIDPEVTASMSLYTLHWVVHFHHNMHLYAANQKRCLWKQEPSVLPLRSDFTVGVLGLGYVGAAVCDTLCAMGYRVTAWSRSGRPHQGVQVFPGSNLDQFLRNVKVLVNTLPSTPDTTNLVNKKMFESLPSGAVLINIGRGATVVDEDLYDALDSGHLKAAVIDTFREEPLPASSPMWVHDKVIVTPHMSGGTFPLSAAKVVADNVKRMEQGNRPFPIVDRKRSY